MNCFSGSNNLHYDFPPIMADGRNFASWQRPNSMDETIRVREHIKTNKDYRTYLQVNADSIMRLNASQAIQQCSVQKTQTAPVANQPFLYESFLDQSKPFGYEDSDLKSMYLSMFQTKGSTITPHVTQHQLNDWARQKRQNN